MGRTNKAIIISGIFAAFLAGTIVAAPQASAANPVLTFLQDSVMQKLQEILDAINGIDSGIDPATQAQIDDIQQRVQNIEEILASGIDSDGDGVTVGDGDCDDSDPSINPGAVEVCDGVDNNCNGTADEGDVCTDADGDGVTADDDCDDNNASVFPGAVEVCDEVDNDCDTQIDEGVTTTFYEDADGDGFGNFASTVDACFPPGSFVEDNTDCDDTNALVNPGGTEILGDSLDNNCDGVTDPVDIFGTWSISPILVAQCTATSFGFPVDGEISMDELTISQVGSEIKFSAVFDFDFEPLVIPSQGFDLITIPFITHPDFDASGGVAGISGTFTSATSFDGVFSLSAIAEDFGSFSLDCNAIDPQAYTATKNP